MSVARAIHHSGRTHVVREWIGSRVEPVGGAVELLIAGKITRFECSLNADDAAPCMTLKVSAATGLNAEVANAIPIRLAAQIFRMLM